MLILYIYLRFRLTLFYESLGVNSLFVNMTWENPISFYCEIKVRIIITIIIKISCSKKSVKYRSSSSQMFFKIANEVSF